MSKKLYIFCLFSIFFLALALKSNGAYTQCYQEFANQTSACGGLGTGNYSISGTFYLGNSWKGTDGDYSTGTFISTGTGWINATYRIPANNVKESTIWQFKDATRTYNHTNISVCIGWSDVLMVSYWTNSVGHQERCYNGTEWKTLHYNSGDINFYEEGVFWNISDVALTTPYNTTSFTVNITSTPKILQDIKFNLTSFTNSTGITASFCSITSNITGVINSTLCSGNNCSCSGIYKLPYLGPTYNITMFANFSSGDSWSNSTIVSLPLLSGQVLVGNWKYNYWQNAWYGLV